MLMISYFEAMHFFPIVIILCIRHDYLVAKGISQSQAMWFCHGFIG